MKGFFKGWSKGEKRAMLAVLCLTAPPLVLATWIADNKRFPAIAYPAEPPAPQPNGFDLYLQAGGLLRRGDYHLNPIIFRKVPPWTVEETKTWLRRQSEAESLIRDAMPLPCAPNRKTFSTSYGNIQNIQAVRNYLLARAKVHQSDGANDQALVDLVDLVCIGADFSSRPIIFPCNLGREMHWDARNAISNFDLVPACSAAVAKSQARRLENALKRISTVRAQFREERFETYRWFNLLSSYPGWTTLGMPKGWTSENETWLQDFGRRSRELFISKRAVVQEITRVYDEMDRSLAGPYSAAPMPPVTSENEVVANFLLDHRKFAFYERQQRVALKLIMLQLALRAFSQEKGLYPAQLSELVPAYLKALPTDDFANGSGYHYKREAKTYRIWSVGPDGVNDGGKAITWPKGSGPKRKNRLPAAVQGSKGDAVAGLNR